MRFAKIIAATDLSEASQVVVPVAIHLGRKTGAEIVLLYATEHVETPAWTVPSAYEQLIQSSLARDELALEALAREISAQGLRVSIRMVDDRPAQAIVERAAALDADVVVVGTHGRTGLQRFPMGSVSEQVTRHSPTSVWVVRPGRNPGLCKHILVPTDFSPAADQALEAAISLVEPGGRISVLHCWSLPPGPAEPSIPGADPDAGPDAGQAPGILLTTLRDLFMERGQARGRALIEHYSGSSFTITFENLEASPRQGIQMCLDKGEFDLVVMGSHGRRGLARWLLGSVAEATVRSAPCSVLVVRHQGPGPVAPSGKR